MVTEETMRRVLQEHVHAENAHDRGRVLATYIERGAEFVDVPTGNVFRDGDEIIANYTNLWDGLPNLVRRIDRSVHTISVNDLASLEKLESELAAT